MFLRKFTVETDRNICCPFLVAPRAPWKMLPRLFFRILIFFLVPCKQNGQVAARQGTGSFFLSFPVENTRELCARGCCVLLLRSNFPKRILNSRFVIAEAMTF